MDPSGSHPWFSFSPLPGRPQLEWPDGARVAVSVVLDLRAAEWEGPDDVLLLPPGGRGKAPSPDIPRMSHREFGHRVGIFRLFEIMKSLGIRPAVVVDVLTAEGYGRLVDHLTEDTGEWIAGGLSASRPITSRMGEDEEAHYIATTQQRLEARLGLQPVGWSSPGQTESTGTPLLLARHGIEYVLDWGNDEQPYPMPGAGIWGFPLSWELTDLRAMFERSVLPRDYGRSIVEAHSTLDAEDSGRVLALHLHPWISGQAFRAGEVEAALAQLRDVQAVWWATPGEVVAWCREHRNEGGST